MKYARSFVAFAVSGLLLLACANQMQPAQSALDTAQNAVNAAKPDASKYMPEHYQRLQAELSAAQASFDKQDYAAVLNSAPALTADAQSVQQQAAAKKASAMTALAAQWNDISTSVPKMIESIKARLDELGKNKLARKNIDVATAQTDLSDASSMWSKAEASHSAGDVQAAVTAGKDVEAKAEAAADALKLKLPTAA
jgi:hypothetical protein